MVNLHGYFISAPPRHGDEWGATIILTGGEESKAASRRRRRATGDTGYIGSHTCVALAQAGHDIVILNNLSNSQVSVIDRLENALRQAATVHPGRHS